MAGNLYDPSANPGMAPPMSSWPAFGQHSALQMPGQGQQGPGQEQEQLRRLLDAVRGGSFNGQPMMAGAPTSMQGMQPPGMQGQIMQAAGVPPPPDPYAQVMAATPISEPSPPVAAQSPADKLYQDTGRKEEEEKEGGMTPEVKAMLASQLPAFGASVGKMFDVLAGHKPTRLI